MSYQIKSLYIASFFSLLKLNTCLQILLILSALQNYKDNQFNQSKFIVRFKSVPNEVYEKSNACTTDVSISCSYIALIDGATMLCLVMYLQENMVRGLLK